MTEIIWDTAGREWIPKRLVWRDPRWFMFDWISGEELLVRTLRDQGPLTPTDAAALSPWNASSKASGQEAPHYRRARWYAGTDDEARIGIQPLTAPLAPFKFIVHAPKAKAGLPVRGGLARAAGWAYLFKNYVLKDWVTFAEVFGQPLRLGKYSPGATEADKQALLSAVANIGTDAAAIIPESMLIEFVETRGNGGAELYERFCEYLDKQVSKAVLGQTLTTETPRDGGGSRAAAQVHDSVRRDIMESDARRLGATLTRDLVRPIVDLNLGPQRRYPRIALGLSADNDIKLFADIVAGTGRPRPADRSARGAATARAAGTGSRRAAAGAGGGGAPRVARARPCRRRSMPGADGAGGVSPLAPSAPGEVFSPGRGCGCAAALRQALYRLAVGAIQRQRRSAVVAQHYRRARLAGRVEQRETR